MDLILSNINLAQLTVASYASIALLVVYLLVSTLSQLQVTYPNKAQTQYSAFATNFPKIARLPEVPGSLPFIGKLHLLGGRLKKNDCTVYSEWSAQLNNADIFQVRLGNQRVIVVNSWSAMKDLWISHSNDLCDRPDQPEFVEKLGVDITGTDLTPQIRRCRAAAMRALGKTNWPRYYHLLQPTSVGLVRDMYEKGGNGKVPVDVYYHLRHVVFDLALSLTYGARFGEVDDAFMTKFLWSINAISAVRNSTKSFRHWVPILRWIPQSMSETIRAERVRAKHVDVLYSSFRKRVAEGETVDCIVASLGEDKLSEEEIHGTCLSLLQAAPDTVASGLYQCIGWLCSAEGRPFQGRVYQAILDAYEGDRKAAWDAAFREEKVAMLVSLYKVRNMIPDRLVFLLTSAAGDNAVLDNCTFRHSSKDLQGHHIQGHEDTKRHHYHHEFAANQS